MAAEVRRKDHPQWLGGTEIGFWTQTALLDGFGRFLDSQSALALAPRPIDPRNVKLGKTILGDFCRFWSILDDFCRFWSIFVGLLHQSCSILISPYVGGGGKFTVPLRSACPEPAHPYWRVEGRISELSAEVMRGLPFSLFEARNMGLNCRDDKKHKFL